MTIKALQTYFREMLSQLYPKDEIDTFFHWLVEDRLELKPIDINIQAQNKLNQEDLLVFKNQLHRLQQQEPIQYILGYTEFYGLHFKVNPQVLIPRPETEALVNWVLEDHDLQSSKKLIDVGTGSGCIAVALKKQRPNFDISAIDISIKAIDVASQNAKNHQTDINFFCLDILKIQQLPNDYQIIVSNPPYVRYLEKAQMRNNVLSYEPHEALFVENLDPLLFYKTICRLAKNLPLPVYIYFEINQYLVEDLKTMLQDFNLLTFDLRQDFRENMRMLRIIID